MSKLWSDLVWMLGINTEKVGAERMGEQLFRMTEYVFRNYQLTTLEDIQLAYDLACRGELAIEKVIPSLNPLEFGKVMSAYKAYQTASVAIQQRNNNQALFCELPPSQQYVDNLMREALQIAYKAVADGDTYPDFGNSVYDWLDARGSIPFDAARKWEFYTAAKGSVRQLSAERLNAGVLNNHAKAPIRRMVKIVMSDVLDEGTSNKIRAHAKYLAINQLLKDLVELDVTIDEFLNTDKV